MATKVKFVKKYANKIAGDVCILDSGVAAKLLKAGTVVSLELPDTGSAKPAAKPASKAAASKADDPNKEEEPDPANAE